MAIFYLFMAIGCFYVSYISFPSTSFAKKYYNENKFIYTNVINFKGFEFTRIFGNAYKCSIDVPIEIQQEAIIKFDIEINNIKK